MKLYYLWHGQTQASLSIPATKDCVHCRIECPFGEADLRSINPKAHQLSTSYDSQETGKHIDGVVSLLRQ